MANGGRIDYTIGYNVDQQSINKVRQSLKSLSDIGIGDFAQINDFKDLDTAKKKLEEVRKTVNTVEQALKASFNSNLGTLNVSQFNQELKKSNLTLQQTYTNFSKLGSEGKKAFLDISSQILSTNTYLKQTNTIADKIGTTLKNTLQWNLSSSVINSFVGGVQQAYGYVKNLDTSLNDIRIVTGKSADEMDRFALKANKAAEALGKSTTDYTKASLIYYQQGLSDEETAARTDVTLKAANVTQQSTAEVSEQLTAVWNGYKVSAQEAELYVDKLAAVAAATAADLEELSTGMSKVASAANMVGVDVDQMNAMLATTISVTRQAPETVGTAYKTILARMTTIEAGGTDEDGANLTSYTEKMNKFGINVLDTNGHLREMGDVIEEVGEKWQTMNEEQKITLAQVMAGTRQYNNLTALFDNWDMYTAALQTSADAAGTLQEQQDIYMDSTKAHLQQLSTAAEGVYDSLLTSTDINNVADVLTTIVSGVEQVVDAFGGGVEMLASFTPMIIKAFSKDIANNIIRVTSNVQGLNQNLQNAKGQMQFLGELKGVNFDSKSIEQATANMAKLQQYAQKYSSVMTKEQSAILDSMIASTAAIAKQKIEVENEAQEFVKFYNKVKNVNESVESLFKQDSSKLREELLDLSAPIDEMISSIESYQNTLQNLGTSAFQGEALFSNLNISNFSAKFQGEINTIKDNLNAAIVDGTKKGGAEGEAIISKAFQQALSKLRNLGLPPELIDQLDGVKSKLKSVTEAEKEAGKTAEETGKKMQKAFNVQSVTNLISSVGQLAMAIKQLSDLSDIWNDEDLEPGEKAIQIVTTLSFALPSLIMGLSTIGTAITALVPALGAEAAAATGAAGATVGLQVALGPVGWALLAITAAVAAVAVGLAIWTEKQQKQTKELEKATEATKKLTQNYKSLKEEVENFDKTLQHLNESKDVLDKLVVGTDEWKTKIQEINEEVATLLENYSELSNYISTDKNGMLVISEEGQEIIKKKNQEKLAQANTERLIANGIQDKEENDVLLEKLIQKAVSKSTSKDYTFNVGGTTEPSSFTHITQRQLVENGIIDEIINSNDVSSILASDEKLRDFLIKSEALTNYKGQDIQYNKAVSSDVISDLVNIISEISPEILKLSNDLNANNKSIEIFNKEAFKLNLNDIKNEDDKQLLATIMANNMEQYNPDQMSDEYKNWIENLLDIDLGGSQSLDKKTAAEAYANLHEGYRADDGKVFDEKGEELELTLEEMSEAIWSKYATDAQFALTETYSVAVDSAKKNFGNIDTSSILTGNNTLYNLNNNQLNDLQQETTPYFNIKGGDYAAIHEKIRYANEKGIDINSLLEVYKDQISDIEDYSKQVEAALDIYFNGIQEAINNANEEQGKINFSHYSEENAWNKISQRNDFQELTIDQQKQLAEKIKQAYLSGGQEAVNELYKNIESNGVKIAFDSEEAVSTLSAETQQALDDLKIPQEVFERYKQVFSARQGEEVSDAQVLNYLGSKKDINAIQKDSENFFKVFEGMKADDLTTWTTAQIDNLDQLSTVLEEATGQKLDDTWIIEHISDIQAYINNAEGAYEKMKELISEVAATDETLSDIAENYSDTKVGELIAPQLDKAIQDAGQTLNANEEQLENLYAIYGYKKNEDGQYIKFIQLNVQLNSEIANLHKKVKAEDFNKALEESGLTEEDMRSIGWSYDSKDRVWTNPNKDLTLQQSVNMALQLTAIDSKYNVKNPAQCLVDDAKEQYGITEEDLESQGWYCDYSDNGHKVWHNDDENATLEQVIEFSLSEKQADELAGHGGAEKVTSDGYIQNLIEKYGITRQDLMDCGWQPSYDGGVVWTNPDENATLEQVINYKTKVNPGDDVADLDELPATEAKEANIYKVELDPYESLTSAIDNVTKSYEKLKEVEDQLTGDALTKNLEEQNKLLEEKKRLQEELIKSMSSNVSVDKQKLAGMGAKFDDAGNITNVAEVRSSLTSKVNGLDQNDESNKKLIKDYGEQIKVLDKYIQENTKLIDAMDDLNEITAQIELNDMKKQIASISDEMHLASAEAEIAAEKLDKVQKVYNDDDMATADKIENIVTYTEEIKKQIPVWEGVRDAAKEAKTAAEDFLKSKGVDVSLFGTIGVDQALQQFRNGLESSGMTPEQIQAIWEMVQKVAEEWKTAEKNEEDATSKLEDYNDELATSVKEMEALSNWQNQTAERQISLIDRQLKRVQKASSGLEGNNLIVNLQQQKSLINQQIVIKKREIEQETAKLKLLRQQTLEKLKQKALDEGVSLDFKFLKDGSIDLSNLYKQIDNQKEKISDELLSLIKAGVEDYNKGADNIIKLKTEIEGYQDSLADLDKKIQDTAKEAAKKAAEKLKKEMELALKMFNAKVDVEVNVEDAWREINKLEKRIQGLKDTDVFGNAILDYKNLLEYINANPNSYFGEAGGGSIQILTQHVNDIMSEIATIQGGGQSSLYGKDQDKAFSDLYNYQGQLISQVNAFYDQVQAVKDSYGKMVDKIVANNQSIVKSYENINALLQHGIELNKSLYGEDSYKEQYTYYNRIVNNDEEILQQAIKNKQEAARLLESALLVGDEEQIQAAKDRLEEAMNEVYAHGETLLDHLKESVKVKINASFEGASNQLAQQMGFVDYWSQQQDWERWKMDDSMFIDPTNTLYEMTILANKFNEAISGTDSLSAKKKLTEVMNEQLGILQKQLDNGKRLTQYDVDRANKVYELTLRQIALEEAQQNKSQMRLRRDSQGNYRYEYIADDDKINDAKQKLLDAENDLYNFDKQHTIELQDQAIQMWEEYRQKILEIEEHYGPEETAEKLAEMQKVSEFYGGLMGVTIEGYATTLKNVRSDTQEELTLSNTTIADSIMKNWDKFKEQEEQRFQQITADITAEGETASTALDEMKQGYNSLEESIIANVSVTQEFITEKQLLNDEYENELNNITALLLQLKALEDQYKMIAQAALEAATNAQMLRQNDWSTEDDEETSAAIGGETADWAVSAKIQDSTPWSTKEPRNGKESWVGAKTDGSGTYYISTRQVNKLTQDERKRLDSKYKILTYDDEDTLKKKKPNIRDTSLSFDTGGYTGEWGSDGRMAMLHQKELVLNAKDTENILQSVNIVRNLSSVIDGLSMTLSALASNALSNTSQIPNITSGGDTQLDQNVKIEANFPNVQSASEIEQAFNNLVNLASQRAMNTKR